MPRPLRRAFRFKNTFILSVCEEIVMGGHKAIMEEIREEDQSAWESVAKKNGFFCYYCGEMLSKEEVEAFRTACSKHQNGWEKSA
jgi:hypothetical protein